MSEEGTLRTLYINFLYRVRRSPLACFIGVSPLFLNVFLAVLDDDAFSVFADSLTADVICGTVSRCLAVIDRNMVDGSSDGARRYVHFVYAEERTIFGCGFRRRVQPPYIWGTPMPYTNL